jgi:hypothetical protein
VYPLRMAVNWPLSPGVAVAGCTAAAGDGIETFVWNPLHFETNSPASSPWAMPSLGYVSVEFEDHENVYSSAVSAKSTVHPASAIGDAAPDRDVIVKSSRRWSFIARRVKVRLSVPIRKFHAITAVEPTIRHAPSLFATLISSFAVDQSQGRSDSQRLIR